MDKLRAGDVVRLKPMTVARVYPDGSFYVEEADFVREDHDTFEPDVVEEILSRVETDAEKIKRLEAEIAAFKNWTPYGPSDKPRWNTCAPKAEQDTPWYPPQQEGYGPWIEGRVPKDVLHDGTFQALYNSERDAKCYISCIYRPGGLVVIEPDRVAAYCIKLED